MIGNSYGYWLVLEESHTDKYRRWLCVCVCGMKKHILQAKLRNGQSKSCGCQSNRLRSEAVKTHGMSNTRTYHIWESMRSRVNSKSDYMRKYYADRGISCTPKWNDFSLFQSDMGCAPEGMTLDRIDNNKGYFKDNCRWATQMQQMNNIRRNRHVTVNGVTLTVSQWARSRGMNAGTVSRRLDNGWSDIDAIMTPVKKIHKVTFK